MPSPPTHMRRMRVDLPRPGRPSAKIDGFEMIPDWNHEIGSAHTVAPVSRCRPSGTPLMGLLDPTA